MLLLHNGDCPSDRVGYGSSHYVKQVTSKICTTVFVVLILPRRSFSWLLFILRLGGRRVPAPGLVGNSGACLRPGSLSQRLEGGKLQGAVVPLTRCSSLLGLEKGTTRRKWIVDATKVFWMRRITGRRRVDRAVLMIVTENVRLKATLPFEICVAHGTTVRTLVRVRSFYKRRSMMKNTS